MTVGMKCFVLSVIFIFLRLDDVSIHAIKRCSSNILQKHLDQMEAKQDTTTSPCNDFYTYACGNWDSSYQLRKLGARDTLSSVKAENKLLLIQHFDSVNDEQGASDASPTHKCLLNFYNSCLGSEFRDDGNTSIRMQAYADVLRQFSDDWPILNSQASDARRANDSFNWEYVTAQLRRYGVNSFWRTMVQPNWQNSEQLIFYIVPPSFRFLQRSKRAHERESAQHGRYKTENNESYDVFIYKTYVKYLLLDLGVRVRKALLYADKIVGFEQNLMSLTSEEENLVILKAPQTLASLVSEFPQIQLQKFFDVLLQDVPLPEDYEHKLLIVADNTYLQKLSNLLKKTKVETIGMYLLIEFLAHFEVNLHDDEPYGATQEHCLQQANNFLPKELSRLFLDLKHNGYGMDFLKLAQDELTSMFDNLKFVFESMINDTTVFDQNLQTRNDGLEKLKAMQLRLPDLKNDNESNATACSFLLSGNYDSNLLYLSKLKSFEELMSINKSLNFEMEISKNTVQNNMKRLDMVYGFRNYGPLDVNAYYRLKKNAIEIPVGLLSLPLYDACLEAPMIYGTIAFIIGHELLHGFDYDGLNYDKIGNISDGWDPKSIIAYGTKASCYLGTRYENAHTNVNENIADTEGLRLALGAMEKQHSGVQMQSDKLKLFFTSFAQIWCRSISDTKERHILHAAHRERVNNVLGNFQSFAETFHCKLGSAMNPVEKCRIW